MNFKRPENQKWTLRDPFMSERKNCFFICKTPNFKWLLIGNSLKLEYFRMKSSWSVRIKKVISISSTFKTYPSDDIKRQE